MKEKNLIISAAVLVAIILIAGYFLWVSYQVKTKQEAIQKAEDTVLKSIEKTASDTIPNITPQSNPIKEKLPEVNPIEKTNPFKNVYKNPFE